MTSSFGFWDNTCSSRCSLFLIVAFRSVVVIVVVVVVVIIIRLRDIFTQNRPPKNSNKPMQTQQTQSSDCGLDISVVVVAVVVFLFCVFVYCWLVCCLLACLLACVFARFLAYYGYVVALLPKP